MIIKPYRRFVPLIREHFDFLVREYGFVVQREGEDDTTASYWVLYSTDDREVFVGYAGNRDRVVEVDIECTHTGWSEDPATFANPDTYSASPRKHFDDAESFTEELRRESAQLQQLCGLFLRGDIPAFMREYREAILVNRVRSWAYTALASREYAKAIGFYDLIRGYWTDQDAAYCREAQAASAVT